MKKALMLSAVRRSIYACVVAVSPALLRAAPPKVFSPADLQAISNDSAQWTPIKTRCDRNLNVIIQGQYDTIDNSYSAAAWKDAVRDYGICYNVAKLQGDAVNADKYAKKAVAVMKAITRDHWYGTPAPSDEFVAIGDGTTKSFPLRMAPAGSVTVRLAPLTQTSLTYQVEATNLPWTGADNVIGLPGDAAVVKISNTPGGPADYVRGVDFHDGYYHLRWSAARHPAAGAVYYLFTADQNFTTASGVSASGATLNFTNAPPAGQAIFASYMGPNYEQSGNRMGYYESSIRPDTTYFVRNITVGLAIGYDLMREDAADMPPALRQEFYGTLNAQLDFITDMVTNDPVPNDFYNPYIYTELGNYTTEGRVPGMLYGAYATEEDNPRAFDSCTGSTCLKTQARAVLMRTYNALVLDIPGGYGFEGSYTNGSFRDLFEIFDFWKRVTGEDLPSQTSWTQNMVRAIIHGTKPDRTTWYRDGNGNLFRGNFYDGGDWGSLPAEAELTALAGFIKYQGAANPTLAANARQLIADVGSTPPAGTLTDYKSGAGAYPLSYMGKGTGVLYARSDWNDLNAVWLSMSLGPIYNIGHEHYDRGHFTFQRGSDYLVINPGGYGQYQMYPYHNTLGFPNFQNWQAGENAATAVPNKYTEGGGFVYSKEDMSRSYDDGSGTVKRAVRTLVYFRPDVVVVHDQSQTAAAATQKTFNINFNTPSLTHQAGTDLFSSVTGASKVFMRSLVPSNPDPLMTVTPMTYNYSNVDLAVSNYQVKTTGKAADTFLHVFQMTPSGQAAMAPSAYIQSADTRAQGAVVDMGARRWVAMNASTATVLSLTATAPLIYTVPLACPCSHVVGDLPPSTTYPIFVNGAPGSMPSATTDVNGVLYFTTDDAGTGDQIKLGNGVSDVMPPARPRGLRNR